MSDHAKENAKLGNIEEYVTSAIQGFVTDPPDTDSQWGYLSALLAVAQEALGQRMDMPPFAQAHELQKNYQLLGKPWDEDVHSESANAIKGDW